MTPEQLEELKSLIIEDIIEKVTEKALEAVQAYMEEEKTDTDENTVTEAKETIKNILRR